MTVAKTKFEPLRFVCFLILSPILFEYSAWGQCDAIYTSFAMLAFLFALKKKSKLSFLFVGLSFAVKLQFLFVVPVLFVMLIVKDEKGEHYLKWKDIWIAPLMYAVNLVPAFAGRNVLDLLLVYANQTGTDYGVSSNCANVLYFYTLLEDYLGVNVPWLETLLIALFVVITILVLVLILYVVFKRNKIKKLEQKDLVFFGVLFSFAMVFLMPKMLDRFYFIPMAMACVWFFVDKSFSSKIVPVLIHNALYFMMYLTYIDYIKGFISIAISVVAMVSAFVAAGMLIVYTKNKYLDEIKSE